ncbi:hypothetical protein A7L03_18955 [Acinetobacter baumannii]|nr:hypothetical protein A7L03_18955 [Acinetobacter baumannii]
MSLAVGEEVVDDHSDDGEEEDDKGPEDLVGDGTVGLEDFDPSNDIKNQHNKPYNPASSTCLPWLSRLHRNRRRLSQHKHRQLQAQRNDKVHHDGGSSGAFGRQLISSGVCSFR